MKNVMVIALWISASVALMLTLPIGWMGVDYLYGSGYGLHPLASGMGIALCLVLCWASAHLADSYDL